MKTKELGNLGGVMAAALLLIAAVQASAAPQAAKASETRAPASVLSQALDNIRGEQRRAMQKAAQAALAGQRSEIAAALSQGGTVGASNSVQASR